MTERFNPENIDRFFREELQNYAEVPHAHVWASIRKEVPIKKSFVWYRWAAVLAIFLAFGAGMFTQSWLSTTQRSNTAQINHIEKSTASVGNSTLLAIQNTTHKRLSHNSIHPAVNPSLDFSKKDVINSIGEVPVLHSQPDILHNRQSTSADFISDGATQQPSILFSEPVTQLLDNNLHSIDNLPFTDLTTLNEYSYNGLKLKSNIVGSLPPAPKRNHFYIGVNASFNHVNIIDHKNLNNPYQFQFIKTQGLADGFQAGWNMTNHWGIEARFTIHSFEGQRYSYRVNEKYMPEREIRLDYYYFPLLLKYQCPLNSFTSFVVMGGFEYGKYRTNDAFEYNQATSQLKHFRPTDVASILASGIDVPVSHHIGIGIYANATYGSDLGALSVVPGDYKQVSGGKANRQTSDDFSHPHNLVYGLNVALNYKF